jgi:hypothetical protein
MDQSLFAAPHGFSQRTTSFIASQRQGIHQMPLRRLIALISQCPDNPDDTPWNEASPQLSAGTEITGIGKTSCKDLPLHPFGRACGQARPAMTRTTSQTAQRPPRHGTESQIPSSQCQRSCLPTRTPGKSCLVSMGCRLRMPNAIEAWWSQTGSNRRPPACKAGALPTELWPQGTVVPATGVMSGVRTNVRFPSPRPRLRVVGLGRLELPTSRLSGVRSNQTELQARFLARGRGKAGAPKSNPGRKRNEDGETRQMGPEWPLIFPLTRR